MQWHARVQAGSKRQSTVGGSGEDNEGQSHRSGRY